jgi:perosamine synthetase
MGDRMIHLSVPNLAGNENKYLQDCVSTNFVSSVGPYVQRFEKMLSEASGTPNAVTTSSGTTALHMALLAAGVKSGDLVIIPSFTFIGTANAVSHCGAQPWLMDIESEGWTLDPELLARELHSHLTIQNGQPFHRELNRRVGAVMPVHVLGNPAELDSITAVAAQYGIPVVSDGAAAIGAAYKGKPIGYPGTLTALSFNGNKTVTCGGGGAVLGDSREKIEFIRHISSTARVGSSYHHDQIGYNFRLTNIQAAVGCAQMERLDDFIQRKRAADSFYRERLEPAGFHVFPRPSWGESSCWFSGIVLHKPEPAKLIKALAGQGVEARPFWKPIHLQPPYASAPRSDLRHTEAVWDKIVTLPCSTSITDEQLMRVADAVLRVAKGRAA